MESIPPHGGVLVNRWVLAQATNERAPKDHVRILVSMDVLTAIFNIADGVFSPLVGFMTQDEFEGCVFKSRLPDGSPWTLPIMLPVDDGIANSISNDARVLLCNPEDQAVARMEVRSKFSCDRKVVAQNVFGTDDAKHPGVAALLAQPSIMIGGPIEVFGEPADPLRRHHIRPVECRQWFAARRWGSVCAFQTRNVPHAGHEYLQKAALSLCDGLMIQPVIGRKKPGDFRDDVILDAYRTIIDLYFPSQRVLLNILPFDMRYAGPREAIFHAIVRKNYGCTHMIVGRDHAGVGAYYHPEAAIEIFKEFPDVGVTPIAIRGDFFHCRRCGSIASDRTCPHSAEDHVSFSGTEIRKLLHEGKRPPEEIMRPEVFDVLRSVGNPFVS